MRIVEINTVCDTGSTGRIAAGVARIAADRGHEAYVAYGRGSHPEDIRGYKIGNNADLAGHVLSNFFKGNSGFASKHATENFLKWLDDIRPDLIHLHNIHGFYIHVGMLFDYIKKNDIPVIWTLHDCWPFTGQCAYFDYAGCDKWVDGCRECPIYRTDYPYSIFKDNSAVNYPAKKAAFTGVNDLIVVTPSRWLEDLVKRSFLQGYDMRVLYNGIDTDRFRVMTDALSTDSDHSTQDIAEKSDALNALRSEYDLTSSERLILGVANVWSARKGIEHFYRLTELLPKDHKIALIGVSEKTARKIRDRYGDRIIPITHTDSVEELVAWYNLADVFVNPTMEDNFPSTDIEALACGTPVIAFDTGGCGEIDDRECVKLIAKGDTEALAEAIKEITGKKSQLTDRCRTVAEAYKAGERLAAYVDLAEEMINRKNNEHDQRLSE